MGSWVGGTDVPHTVSLCREVSKKKGQEYSLLWKDEPDFVRLAAKCG